MTNQDEELLAHVKDKHHDNPRRGCRICKSHKELEAMNKEQLIGLVELQQRSMERWTGL